MKKIFLFLTISLFSIPAMYAVVTWDGTSSEMWTQGTGTEADPYLIETPANLAYLSAQVTAGKTYAGVYFQQTEDFDLQSKTWTPIGTSTYKFAGIYDGGNKFISNLTNSIFGSIIDATIMNITLQGVDINTNENNTAILVERTFDDCKITNCHNKINIKISSFEMTNINNSNDFILENYHKEFLLYESRHVNLHIEPVATDITTFLLNIN